MLRRLRSRQIRGGLDDSTPEEGKRAGDPAPERPATSAAKANAAHPIATNPNAATRGGVRTPVRIRVSPIVRKKLQSTEYYLISVISQHIEKHSPAMWPRKLLARTGPFPALMRGLFVGTG